MSENFSDQLKALEQIADEMDSEELDLENSFKLFDKGMKLALACEKKLKEYEKKIEIIKNDQEY